MIYSTNITPLAVLLAQLGVPWADPKNPDWLCYPSDVLEKEGRLRDLRDENGNPRAMTAEEARDKGVKGVRMYFFGDHPERDEIIRQFQSGYNVRPGRVEWPEVPTKALAEFGGMLFRNRKIFMESQRKTPAKVLIKHPDGSYSVVGKDARPEDLAKLGLS